MKRRLALGSIVLFLAWTFIPLVTGGSWDRVEGLVAIHQTSLFEGRLDVPGAFPRIPLYGALWYRLTAVCADPSTAISFGRIMSISSLVGVALVSRGALSRSFGAPVGAASLGATVWLGWLPAMQFGGSDRCDGPALLLASTGWILGRSPQFRSLGWGGLLAGLSSAFRPTSGLESILWGISAMVAERRAAKAFLLWIGCGIVGQLLSFIAFLCIHGVSGLPLLALAGKSGADPGQSADLLLRLAPLGALALGAAALPRVPRSLAVATVTSWLLAGLLAMRPGANLNWFLGPTWLLGMCLGLGTRTFPRAITLLGILQTWLVQTPRLHSLWIQAHQTSARAALVATLDRPVLTADALPVLLVRGQVAIDDPHLVEDLSARHALASDLVEDALRSNRWAILTDPDLFLLRRSHWSPGVRRWMLDSTRVCGQAGETQLRLPLEAPCPRSR